MNNERPGAIGNLPVYTYLNFDARFLAQHKFLLPGWLKAKTMVNSNTKGTPATGHDLKLFGCKVVDVLTLLDDFSKEGRRPSHIHMMNREHHGVRVRITWFKDGDVLPGAEIEWITNMIGRFFWDTMSYKRFEGSEHLPPHVSVHMANPVERDRDTSVFSVQLVDDEPVLINDPS